MKKKEKKTGIRPFTVLIPLAGRLTISVEADGEEAAKEAAWDKFNELGEAGADDIEWEAMDIIAEGNCCSAPQNEIEANED
jgi:hypothetical protein